MKPDALHPPRNPALEAEFKLKGYTNAQPTAFEEHPFIAKRVQEMAKKGNISTPRFYVYDAQLPMAMAVMPQEAILVSRNLFQLLNEREIVAVIGHEMGHMICKHPSFHKQYPGRAAVAGAAIGAARVAYSNWQAINSYATKKPADEKEQLSRREFLSKFKNDTFYHLTMGVGSGMILGLMAQTYVYLSQEMEADHISVTLCEDRDALISGLEKILKAHNAMVYLDPNQQRVSRLRHSR